MARYLDWQDRRGLVLARIAQGDTWCMAPPAGRASPWIARLKGVDMCSGPQRDYCPARLVNGRLRFDLQQPGLYEYGRWARSETDPVGRRGFVLMEENRVLALDSTRALALARNLVSEPRPRSHPKVAPGL